MGMLIRNPVKELLGNIQVILFDLCLVLFTSGSFTNTGMDVSRGFW